MYKFNSNGDIFEPYGIPTFICLTSEFGVIYVKWQEQIKYIIRLTITVGVLRHLNL